MILNTAGQKIGAQMVSATDGSAFTGSVTVAVTVDAGTQATGSVGSGACTHEGGGYHTYAPAQAETNGALVAFTFSGTGAIPTTVQVYTNAGDAFTRLGAPAGASVSADVAAIKAETASILTDTGTTLQAELDGIQADTEDIQAKLGTPAGASVSADVAAVKVDTAAILVDTGTTLQAELDGIQADTEDLQTKIGTPAGVSIAADIAAVTAPTAAAVADAVWDEAQAGHVGAGTFGVVASEIADILVDTAEIGAAGAGLTEAGGTGDHLTALATAAALDTVDNFLDTEIAAILAAVDTEVAAILALLDDARGEPGQGAPPVNPDAMTKIDYLYKLARNKVTQTATTLSVFADDGTTVDHKSTVSDDATTYTRGELVTGP